MPGTTKQLASIQRTHPINQSLALPQHGQAVIMTKYTVIDDFRQISFRSYRKALAYCAENNVSQNNIFVDER